jgi:nuclear GTP-binding protein
MHLLKNYGRSEMGGSKAKAHISVGVVGYPNVGKSSLVNSLKGECRGDLLIVKHVVGQCSFTPFCHIRVILSWGNVPVTNSLHLAATNHFRFFTLLMYSYFSLLAPSLHVPHVAFVLLLQWYFTSGRSVVGTSSTAGFTTAMAEVSLDKHVTLLDSPGVVFSDGADAQLRNCLNPEELDDPQGAVAAMLQRVSPEQLMQLYALPRFPAGDADAFLSLAARRLGKVKKGGIPDKDATAVAVLRDWNSGAVSYYTPPPADDAHLVGMEAATLVPHMGPAFDPATMLVPGADAVVLETATGAGQVALSQVGASGADGMGEEDEEEEGVGDGMGNSSDDNNDDESDGFEDENSEDEEGSEDDDDDDDEEEEPPAPPPKAAPKASKAASTKATDAKTSSAAKVAPKASAKKASILDDPMRDLATGSTDTRRSQKANAKKAQKNARRGGRNMNDDDDCG